MNKWKLKDGTARGTRILTGESAKRRRYMLTSCQRIAEDNGFEEIVIPSIELSLVYTEKMGKEVLEQMYEFKDKKGRSMSLRPEGTATLQILARTRWRQLKDVKLWYETSCWRYERPQKGRYREFTQFGIEILNPTKDYTDQLISLSEKMIATCTTKYEVKRSVARGLDYYVSDGFEIIVPSLGAQKQVLGGGSYAEGIGFAIGIDRLMLVEKTGVE